MRRLRLTIRARVLLASNLLMLAVALLSGWIAVRVSDQAVEKRLLSEAAGNACDLVGRLNLPVSARLLRDLSAILDAHLAVWDRQRRTLVAATLPDADQPGFAAAVGGMDGVGSVGRYSAPGGTYRFGGAALGAGAGTGRADGELYVLMPERDLRIAQQKLHSRLMWGIGMVVLIASLGGVWLSRSICSPIGRISDWVNRVSRTAHQGAESAAVSPLALNRAPPELRRLAADVEGMVGQLARLRGELTREEKLATLGRFAMTVAHELRNPLGGLKMNAQLLAREMRKRGGSVDHSLELVIAEAERMEFFLDELLALVTRGDSAENKDDERGNPVCPVAASVEKLLALMGPRFACSDIAVRWTNHGLRDLACTSIEFEQILFNLIGNAIDALPGGGEITIEAEAAEEGMGRVSVADNGSGIACENDIFAPFFTTKKRGAGLGLHVCRQVVERRGGQIAWARAGGRTVFAFSLPLGKDDSRLSIQGGSRS